MRPARWLSFHWSPERQEIACDGERFAHPLATNTAPSHDIAHLFVAASWLPWKPKGTRDEVCFAEFNAILVEHLGVNVLDALLLQRGSIETVYSRALDYARYFVCEHYAPFPVPFDQALARFREGVAVETLARLSPLFFRTRIFELKHADYRTRTLSARFSSRLRPEAQGIHRTAQLELDRQIEKLRSGSRATYSCAKR